MLNSKFIRGIIFCVIIFLPAMVVAQTLGVSPNSYDFGYIEVGDSVTKSFIVTNEEPGDTEIAISILTPDQDPILYTGPDFEITGSPEFPLPLPENEQIEIEVTFSPSHEGNFEVYLLIYAPVASPAFTYIPINGTGTDLSSKTREFNLSGIEIVKGIDIGDIRYGTMFLGKVYEGGSHVGNWWTVIRHTDTENIEVCGGTNNLLKVKLVVNLNDGNWLLLGLNDPDNEEEVVWDAKAPLCGPACYDEDCVCPSKPDLIEPWNCATPLPEDYGPVATIENLELKQKFGTTLDIEGAFLTGWLCHNWTFIPRVTASLTVILDD